MRLNECDLSLLKGRRIGFAMTGSFCTFARIFPQIQRLHDLGAELQPILSYNAYELDTRRRYCRVLQAPSRPFPCCLAP